jgi:hypothetical protein
MRRSIAPNRRWCTHLFEGPDNQGPWKHTQLNNTFHWMMVAVVGHGRAKNYSMHSWRIYLACALLQAGASSGTIQTMLRWRSDEAVKIYARINMECYSEWLGLASTQEVNSIRSQTITQLSESLTKAPVAGERLAAYEHYWQCEAAKVRTEDDTSTRSANAFFSKTLLKSVVAALPEIDSDMAVSNYRDQATGLNTEATQDDIRFENERDML